MIACLVYATFANRDCKEPDHDKRVKNRGLHDTFNLLKGVRTKQKTIDDIDQTFINIKRWYIEGPRKCNKNVLLDKADENDPKEAPLCPVYTVLNYDVNRKPRTIAEVRCTCRQRRGETAGGSTDRCVPVYYYLTTSRRTGCKHGVYEYIDVIEKVQVGCTSIHRYTISNEPYPEGDKTPHK